MAIDAGLNGTWYNELGSKMTIQFNADGSITGSYTTAVSATGCAKGAFPLTGRWNVDTSNVLSLGFAVGWNNAQSKCYSTTLGVDS
jgi:avidin family protein